MDGTKLLAAKGKQVVLFGPPDSFKAFTNSLGNMSALVKNLGLIFESAFKFDKQFDITPILAFLHWLPVCFRIDFKLLQFVYKALNGQGPFYVADLLIPYSSSRFLRSANMGLQVVPRSKRKLRRDRAFSFAAPRL